MLFDGDAKGHHVCGLDWGILQIEGSYLIRDGEPERLGTLPQEPFAG